jgi:hypothetical protein
LARIGILKTWFLLERVPVFVIPHSIFGAIPAGLGAIVLGIIVKLRPEPETATMICFGVTGPSFLVGVMLMIWPPWWIKPAWYRWLEERHGDIIPLLQEEARAMGRWKWQRRVATQEGLEQWVAEVRQKRGLD